MSDTPAPKKPKKPSHTEMRRSARSFALQALYQWEMSGNAVSDIELQFRMDNDMSGTDLSLFDELLHGVPANVAELDRAYEPFLDRALPDGHADHRTDPAGRPRGAPGRNPASHLPQYPQHGPPDPSEDPRAGSSLICLFR